MYHGQGQHLVALKLCQTHAVAVGEHHYVVVGELCHLVCHEHHRLLCRVLRAEHLEGVFLLAEGIIDSSIIGVGMIAALMVERVPLATADELALPMKHLAVCVAEREGCREHRLLAPRAGSTIQTVVGIPVVHHFAELTCEHAFVFGRSLLADIVGPTVYHIVVFLHSR